MVLDPRQMELARQMFGGGAGASPEADARTRQSQLSFSAMLAAVQSNCQCEACQLLREAIDTMRVRPKQEAPARGSDIAPQT